MKTYRIIRNICLLLGVLIFATLLAYSLYHTADMWTNEGKSEIFDSFWQYYFTRAKGEMLLAIGSLLALGAAAFFVHRCIIKRK